MKIAELFVRVTADASGVSKGLASADRSMRGFEKTVMRIGGLLGGGMLGAAFLRNTIEAQNAVAQLNAVVKSTGGAAGFATPQLTKMAGELQKVSTFSDEAIMGAQGLLLTFTKIKGETLTQATKATLDLAQAMGGDLKGAAIQLGKALQDPITGLTALRRSGVSFSTEQQAVIKQLVATGQSAKAQQIILKELEVQFGGSALAARNTLGGALTALKNAFGDLLEVSGESSAGVVGALNSITAALPTVAGNIGRGLDVIKDQFRRFKRDIMALNLGVAWADAQLRFWDPEAAKELEKARREFWQAQNAIDPLTLPGVFVDAPKGSGGGGGGGGGGAGDAGKALKEMMGRMRDLLSLQDAMTEARMDTTSVDRQIFEAYLRINNEIARGVRLTNEQLAAAISLRTALNAALPPGPTLGAVGMTGVGNVRPTMTVKGSDLFHGKDQYGNRTMGQFPKIDKIPPALDTLGSRIKQGLGDVSNQLISGLTSVATAMLLGGGGRGSQIGGSLGGGIGGALGGALGAWKGAKVGGWMGSAFGPLGTAVGAVLGTLGGSLFGGLFDKKRKVANGLDMMASQLNRVNAALRNTPSGFSVDPYRTGAETPAPRNVPRPTGPVTTITGPIYVNANNPEEMLRELRRMASRQNIRGGVGSGFQMAY